MFYQSLQSAGDLPAVLTRLAHKPIGLSHCQSTYQPCKVSRQACDHLNRLRPLLLIERRGLMSYMLCLLLLFIGYDAFVNNAHSIS